MVFTVIHAAAAQTVLNMNDAVALALKQNLGLERAGIGAEAGKRAAGASWNSLIPSLSAGVSYSRGMSLTGDLTPGREAWTPGIPLSVSVSISPAVITDMQTAKANYHAGLINYETAKQELEFQVRKIFYQILLLQANAEMADRNLASAQARYDETAAKAGVGQVSHLDELSAKVDLENLKPAKRNAETQLTNTLESFALLLGMDPAETITLDGSLEQFVRELTVQAAENSGGIIRQESFSIHSMRIALEVLKVRRSTAWYPYLPSLRLSWSGNLSYANGRWTDNNPASSLSIGISVPFDPFIPRSKAREQIAAMEEDIALQRIKIAEAAGDQNMQIRQNTRLLEQIYENITAVSLNMDLARETYTMWTQSYRQGTADLQQLRNAADSLSRAENQLRQEQYNMLIAVLDLQRSLNSPFGLDAIPGQE
jgi:outer membrane protein TolC